MFPPGSELLEEADSVLSSLQQLAMAQSCKLADSVPRWLLCTQSSLVSWSSILIRFLLDLGHFSEIITESQQRPRVI
jgi:hypothetical protein